jgi:phosphonatase-like hydrolase
VKQSPGDIELVAFDVAGTTIHDAGQVAAAFKVALRLHGIEISENDLRSWRGAAKRQALGHFLQRKHGTVTPEQLEEAYAAFRAELTKRFASQGVQPVAGAEDTFFWLRERSIRIALTTGFDRAEADVLLRAVGWDDHQFAAVVCAEDVAQGRPAPFMIFRAMEASGVLNVRRVMSVGDTAVDLEAGWNAGVQSNVGVLSGAHTEERLRQAPHTHLIPSVAEIPSLWADGTG